MSNIEFRAHHHKHPQVDGRRASAPPLGRVPRRPEDGRGLHTDAAVVTQFEIYRRSRASWNLVKSITSEDHALVGTTKMSHYHDLAFHARLC